MQINYAALSTAGPVRENNEDCITVWQPKNQDEWRNRGAIVVLADGVGGQARGEVASRMACEAAVECFLDAKPLAAPSQTLFQMFAAANIAVYDQNVKYNGAGRMATTLTISMFRHNEVNIGHVGDCRVYAIQQGRIRRVTNDHSYAGVQLKLGLVTVQEAMSSQMRSVLTRTVGQEPTIRADYHTINVHRGDIIVQMCDGMWTQLTEGEIYETAAKQAPDEACKSLAALAERRGADDNLSIQIIQVQAIERLSYYRGLPTYQKENPAVMGTELEVGQVLDDRFRIIDIISRSGMASIFKAIDQNTGGVVALKVPFMQFESDPGFYQRFQREQAIGKALQHPYILKMIDDESIKKSRPYIVMEYLEGQTLGHLMHTIRPMPEVDALKIAGRICEALHYMHEHDVVHRDLKPDNIMICSDGSIRIMDFGIAKFEGQRRLTFGGFTPAMGTPDYMAPEQVKGKRGDAQTDIYSLGAILYEMVTGSVPFEGANPFIIMNSRISGDPVAPRKRNDQISPQVEEIILHAMARNPQERYTSALEMKKELDHPETVQLTGRCDRLVTPNPVSGNIRRYWLVAICVAAPILVFVIAWICTHVSVKMK
ncbi:MAG TPA: protein kinase [Tepidisphaeraceae bacterium]|jgi:serine/threonine-protein kinase|nr:protein kinase [Tepidisphaeraceae bacterium]